MMIEKFKNDMEQSILAMDRLAVEYAAQSFLENNSLIALFDSILSPVMESIGVSWQNGEASLAQVYMAGRICEDIAARFAPVKAGTEEGGGKPDATPAVALLNDYHSLGKNVVVSFLKAAGYKPLDYGRVSVEELVSFLTNDRPGLLLISVLMLPSALDVKIITSHVKRHNLGTKIIVGGAPFRFDKTLWRETGANAMGETAGDALTLTRRFMEGDLS